MISTTAHHSLTVRLFIDVTRSMVSSYFGVSKPPAAPAQPQPQQFASV
jgi:hypothetical protein